LIDRKWRKDLHAYLGGFFRGLGGEAEAVGRASDHVHLLISLKTTDAPANIIRELSNQHVRNSPDVPLQNP
jgi:REP element-mobilizing transposase RayT